MGVASGLFIFTLAGYSTGALVGIYRLSGDVMQVFGPIAIGPILDAFGFTVSFLLMAGFGLLALVSLAVHPTSPPYRGAPSSPRPPDPLSDTERGSGSALSPLSSQERARG